VLQHKDSGKARGTLGFDGGPVAPAVSLGGWPVAPAEPAVAAALPPLPLFDGSSGCGAGAAPSLAAGVVVVCGGNGCALPNSTIPPSCVPLAAGAGTKGGAGVSGACGDAGEECFWYLCSLGISSRSTRFCSFDLKRIVASSVRSTVLTTSGFLYVSACCAVREVTSKLTRRGEGGELGRAAHV